MIKKLLLTLLSICVVAAFMSCSTNDTMNQSSNRSEKEFSSWAIENLGQTVDGKDGISGVDINVIPAWEKTKGKSDVVIAVVDSGVDISRKLLSDRIFVNKSDPINGKDDDANGFVDDYYGWNFRDMNGEIYEDALYDYHGTYVANAILEVAPNSSILPVKFLKGTQGKAKDAVTGIDYAISRGAKIINCSWNFGEYDKELYEVIKANPDVFFVCAAGNSNINIDKDKLYPCSYGLENIINVMSIDNTGKPYDFSGYGSLTVDIAAPGVQVPVIFPEEEKTNIDGTSVSAAFVSGAAALLLSVDSSLSPVKIKKAINESAQKIPALKGKCKSEGLLDVANAINYLHSPP